MIIKILVNILQEPQKKLVKNFFQQILFFGQNWPKFRIFRFFGTPEIAEIFDKTAEITAGYRVKMGPFFSGSLLDLLYCQKNFGGVPAIFRPLGVVSDKATHFWHFSPILPQ